MKFENLQTGLLTVNEDVIPKPYIDANVVYIEDESVTNKVEALEKRVKMIERKQRKMAWQRRHS